MEVAVPFPLFLTTINPCFFVCSDHTLLLVQFYKRNYISYTSKAYARRWQTPSVCCLNFTFNAHSAGMKLYRTSNANANAVLQSECTVFIAR